MSKPILFSLAAAIAVTAAPLAAREPAVDPVTEATEVDYAGFEKLTGDVAAIRAQRLLTPEQFKVRAAQGDTLILDTRSADAYARGHINGAVNLPFSDFTDEKLAEVIGADKGRTILIYCNNNFSDDVAPIMLKSAPLALNIPTFINLFGYGYTNVWELGDTVSVSDVAWVGADAESLLALLAEAKAP